MLRDKIEELRQLFEAETLSPEERAERDQIAKRYPKNPFVYKSKFTPINYTIGFKTATKKTNEPLWWTGTGFKDLGVARGNPEEFKTAEEAEKKLKGEILDFIRKWRGDQAHLIIGW